MTDTLTTAAFEDAFEYDDNRLDNVDFHVDSASFTYNANIGNGEVLCLKLSGTYEDVETGDKGERDEFYKCGNGWEPFNGNRSARREDGRDKLFNGRTAVASFINASVKAGVTKQQIVAKGGPTSVEWVEGLTFNMRQFETDYGGDIGKKSKLLPYKLITGEGIVMDSTPKAKASKPAAAAPVNEVSAALRAKLLKLAKSEDIDSHDKFIDAAFSQLEAEVSGNPAAEGLVVDPAFFDEAQ